MVRICTIDSRGTVDIIPCRW
uniref:Sema domain-containing protein n=1 Tax=Rhizophora mucronata TaxID=61149 RepID=A0A2P2NQM4_RHIMU